MLAIREALAARGIDPVLATHGGGPGDPRSGARGGRPKEWTDSGGRVLA
jgi:hypothetical protein